MTKSSVKRRYEQNKAKQKCSIQTLHFTHRGLPILLITFRHLSVTGWLWLNASQQGFQLLVSYLIYGIVICVIYTFLSSAGGRMVWLNVCIKSHLNAVLTVSFFVTGHSPHTHDFGPVHTRKTIFK